MLRMRVANEFALGAYNYEVSEKRNSRGDFDWKFGLYTVGIPYLEDPMSSSSTLAHNSSGTMERPHLLGCSGPGNHQILGGPRPRHH